VDPGGIYPFCRLTSWTGQHLPEWQSLNPLLVAISEQFRGHVHDRWAAQKAVADATRPEWVVPGTPFTTVTVNNTYSTGLHRDMGDLAEGFSTLAVCRRGEYQGGVLVFARYRVGVDMRHGDLLLLDPHEWHGNTDIEAMSDDAERISLVAYFRTKVQACGPAEVEEAKAYEYAARRSAR
jgi:hypothetical protein